MKTKEFNKIKPYTYFIKRKSDGKKYHGVRWRNISLNISPEKDFAKNYFSSGMLQEEFMKKSDNFNWRLCWTFDTIDEAREYETKINKRIYRRDDWANNSCWPAISFTDEVRKKMSISSSGENHPMYRKKQSVDWINKRVEKNRGQKRSNEFKKNISEKAKERYKNPENNPMFGRTVYGIWLEKYGKEEADKRQIIKNKKQIETKRKLGTAKGKNNSMYGKCAYDIWLEKYGKEEADKRRKEANEKRSNYWNRLRRG